MDIAHYFYTENQVTDLLGVNRITICRWIKGRRFNIQRVGREAPIPKWEVELIQESENHK